jgi:tetratricopeptide (TPR) repeat protein
LQSTVDTAKNLERTTDDEINSFFDEANFLFCSGKYEEAIKCYDGILQLNPSSKIALAYKGFAFQKLKRRDEAVHCYEKALSC